MKSVTKFWLEWVWTKKKKKPASQPDRAAPNFASISLHLCKNIAKTFSDTKFFLSGSVESRWAAKIKSEMGPELDPLQIISSTIYVYPGFKRSNWLKMGQSRPLLFIIVLFTCIFKRQIYNLNNINWWCTWDSNPGRQDGRRRRIHWAMGTMLKIVEQRIRVLRSQYHKQILQ